MFFKNLLQACKMYLSLIICIKGGSIAKLISSFGVFPEPLAREYTRQICEGLAYLHDHKIVHRDIKSANCLVTGEGVVKLYVDLCCELLYIRADFGCSKSIETIMSFGQGCATLCGTPQFDIILFFFFDFNPNLLLCSYMAPEVIRQQRNVGRRSDIWSLGCTLIEMITGQPPYADIKNATACIFKIGM
jgi:serine/threonine protein kinase